ncbi:MAG: hypothetical protein WAR78_14740 [Ferruginibacter sp.]
MVQKSTIGSNNDAFKSVGLVRDAKTITLQKVMKPGAEARCSPYKSAQDEKVKTASKGSGCSFIAGNQNDY